MTVLTIAGSLGLAHGQAGVGKKFDTRDPHECSALPKVTGSAPSPGQIRDLVTCKSESTGGCCIYLVENVKVEIGKSRPFSSWSDVGNQDIDHSQPVYPIRGTADKYQCQPPGGPPYPPKGKNCAVRMASPFQGICYKTTFGDWSCPVQDAENPLKGVQANMPPPK
jgi:hypothetical protein